MTKERYQNPGVGDQVNLRLFSYNNNNFADFAEIEKVEIYYLDPQEKTADNPEGARLVETFEGSTVTVEDVGTHLLEITLTEGTYVIGTYCDVWTVKVSLDQPSNTVRQFFEVYPSLWYTTPIPVVYDFNFHFQPNKFRKGSKQYLIIEIIPNVPKAGDLRQYYENLAIVSNLQLSMEQNCGECVPAEQDLRLVLDNVPVMLREKRHAYYQLDTEDLDCGIYDIWFRLDFGTNIYVSDRYHIQIYD